jgi:hypothetical protein
VFARLSTNQAWASAVAAVAMVVFACGPTTSGIEGISCTSDSDCNTGLKCLAYYPAPDSGADGGCTQYGSVCLEPCTTASDCTQQGDVCAMGCAGPLACIPSYTR